MRPPPSLRRRRPRHRHGDRRAGVSFAACWRRAVRGAGAARRRCGSPAGLQFAAIGVIAAGGSGATAAVNALLLGTRNAAYGMILALLLAALLA